MSQTVQERNKALVLEAFDTLFNCKRRLTILTTHHLTIVFSSSLGLQVGFDEP